MSKTRRKYSQEYKKEAVAMVQQTKQPISEVARNLGINDSMLRRWISEFSEPHRQAFTGQGNARDEELARLKRELAQVKKERDFLREAAAYFAKQPK